MKAIVWTGYGSPEVLQFRDTESPIPKANEVLIRVYAATASTPDSEFRRLKLQPLYAFLLRLYLGWTRPTRVTIPGSEFAGEIVSTGTDVHLFRQGDQVYGYTGLTMGTYAQYVCLPEDQSAMTGVFAQKPDNLTYEEAAAVPFGGLEALHTLQQANIRPGQKVLIVGAGGSIGTYAIQLAKNSGAEVTGVDKSIKFDMLRSIGADHVMDYTREDFTRNGQTYDVIMDTINKSPFSRSLRSLNDHGTYLNANPGLFGWWDSQRSNKRIIPWSAGYSAKNLLVLKEMIEAGKIKPVIDRRYPLTDAAVAHRYVDTGDKIGNVVITIP